MLREARLDTEVRVVADGVHLFDYLYRRGQYADEQVSPRPNLILMDLSMPRMNGHEALAKIKGDPELASIPVIVFSGSKAQDDVLSSYGVGANAYIIKPAGYAQWVDVMRVFARYWMEAVEFPPVALPGDDEDEAD